MRLGWLDNTEMCVAQQWEIMESKLENYTAANLVEDTEYKA